MNAYSASVAVMARRTEPADSLDYFPTPPWATRAFLAHVLPVVESKPLSLLTAADPACGEGHMALVLAESFGTAGAGDIFPYGFGRVADFLHPDDAGWTGVDWIVTNPPFNLAIDFIAQALRFASRGVAMLVRTQFLESEGRFAEIFQHNPPTLIAQYVERVPMHRGRWVVDGKTASAYCWLVWAKRVAWTLPVAGASLSMWIPKSRQRLARHDDWLRFRGCVDVPKGHAALAARAA